MIASLPSVQFSIKEAYRHIHKRASSAKWWKANANRRHRHALNRATKAMCLNPERFWDEGFNAPSLSGWDID
jgi:hypothetical protein